MVGRIDANDTALESYGKCATFLYRNIFLIPYGLKTNLITFKFIFVRYFFRVILNDSEKGANNISLDSYRKCET